MTNRLLKQKKTAALHGHQITESRCWSYHLFNYNATGKKVISLGNFFWGRGGVTCFLGGKNKISIDKFLNQVFSHFLLAMQSVSFSDYVLVIWSFHACFVTVFDFEMTFCTFHHALPLLICVHLTDITCPCVSLRAILNKL